MTGSTSLAGQQKFCAKAKFDLNELGSGGPNA